MNQTEKLLHCQECGREFSFSVAEQDYYSGHGFAYEPGRCPECRKARKATGGQRPGRRTLRPQP